MYIYILREQRNTVSTQINAEVKNVYKVMKLCHSVGEPLRYPAKNKRLTNDARV